MPFNHRADGISSGSAMPNSPRLHLSVPAATKNCSMTSPFRAFPQTGLRNSLAAGLLRHAWNCSRAKPRVWRVARCATGSTARFSSEATCSAGGRRFVTGACGPIQERDVTRLLGGMERTARNQLHLQHAVEGLSVAAISYYVLSLAAAAFKALHVLSLPIQPELAEGLAIGPVVLAVIAITRRTRSRLLKRSAGAETSDIHPLKQPI